MVKYMIAAVQLERLLKTNLTKQDSVIVQVRQPKQSNLLEVQHWQLELLAHRWYLQRLMRMKNLPDIKTKLQKLLRLLHKQQVQLQVRLQALFLIGSIGQLERITSLLLLKTRKKPKKITIQQNQAILLRQMAQKKMIEFYKSFTEFKNGLIKVKQILTPANTPILIKKWITSLNFSLRVNKVQ